MKKNENGSCPKCSSNNVGRYRIPYCGPGDTNYINCTCRRCGHEWQERD